MLRLRLRKVCIGGPTVAVQVESVLYLIRQ
jgi:hypothetical protein